MKGCMLISFIPIQLKAQTASVTVEAENTTLETEKAEKTTVLMSRLKEIRVMDKSTLTLAEKKDLKSELKSIKSNLKAGGQGVYLSVGAIIIIILLLILLL